MKDTVAAFDECSQSFTKQGQKLQTSIFRLFPTSKCSTAEGSTPDLDDEVVSINRSVQQLFAANASTASDKRRNYQLVGAVWLDNPGRDFLEGKTFQNNDGQSADTPGAEVAGEDRMSSTAMESFTQSEDNQPNCFSCHNTRRVSSDIDGHEIIKQKRLNVSHVLSRFLLGSD